MRIGILVVVSAVLTAAGTIRASSSNVTMGAGQTSTDATDAWRQVPQVPAPEPADPHELQVFLRRAQEFDRTSFTHWPLDKPPSANGMGTGMSFGALGPGPHPEIPFYPHESIVVGTFTGFQTYVTPSHWSIFTVVRLEIDRVLLWGDSGVSEGADVDLLLNGGTVIFLNGEVVSSDLYAGMANRTIQPGHTYLLILGFDRGLEAFWGGAKAWDLTAGVAQPLDGLDIERTKEGKSRVGGLPKDQALDAVRKIIEEHDEKADSEK
jgi:hypothetical protein